MFTTKTPLDLADDIAKSVSHAFRALPKNETEVKENFEKLKRVCDSEMKTTTEMMRVYQKSFTGDANPNELAFANKKAQELVSQAVLGGFLLLPGSFFALPFVVKAARDNGIELVPESVKREFNL